MASKRDTSTLPLLTSTPIIQTLTQEKLRSPRRNDEPLHGIYSKQTKKPSVIRLNFDHKNVINEKRLQV